MGGTIDRDCIPNNIVFSHGFMYIELEKNVYYPGETISGSVHLLINKDLNRVNNLEIRIKGLETFNYRSTQKREDNSTRHAYLIFDHKKSLITFFKGQIAVGQYSFKFQIDLPKSLAGQIIPASFIHRQNIKGQGIIKARIRYRIDARLIGVDENEPVLFKYSKRFFIADIPQNAKSMFYEIHSTNVGGIICNNQQGCNIIETKFERNYYLTDEVIKTQTRIDNTQCRAICNKVICSLTRTLVCRGSNGHEFKETQQVSRFEIEGIHANGATNGFQRVMDLVIDQDKVQFDPLRNKKQKHFKLDDLNFAKFMQPTTRGNCIDHYYNLTITREFNNGWCTLVDNPGITINITMNPSEQQVTSHRKLTPPPFWKPIFLDLESSTLTVQSPLNRIEDVILRRETRRIRHPSLTGLSPARQQERQQDVIIEERRPLLTRALFRNA